MKTMLSLFLLSNAQQCFQSTACRKQSIVRNNDLVVSALACQSLGLCLMLQKEVWGRYRLENPEF